MSLSAQTVSVRREVWKVGVTRTYDVEHVSHLRVDGAGINIFDPRAAFAFWGLGGGRVAFDYGSSTVRFGYRIDDPEARHIIESFVRRRPKISESSGG